MMSRKFTTRESILLLILSVIILAAFYYAILWRPVREEIANCKASQIEVEDSYAAEQIRATQKKGMLEKLDQIDKVSAGEIAVYNNIKNEMNELYNVLSNATDYSLSFSQATASGSIVRRDISVTFQTDSYVTAHDILRMMHDNKYRCIIKNLGMSASTNNQQTTPDAPAQNPGLGRNGMVNVNLTITFYETTDGATDLSGLAYDNSSNAQSGTSEGTTN